MQQPDLRDFYGSPNPALRFSIIVPVKDEADCVIDTLLALKDQTDPQGNVIDKNLYEVLVLANNCSDDSYQICCSFRDEHKDFQLHVGAITIPEEIAHIGTVRKLLMDEACRRLMSLGISNGVIISTDGDSQVDSQWIYHIMMEMDKGVDVVSGRILPRDIPAAAKWPHLRDVTYRFLLAKLEDLIDPNIADPWPRHFQCYGPSIAVTCEMYTKVGGMKAIPFLEDEDFRRAVNRVDAKIRKSPLVKIYTSSRLIGRVEFGFSIQLTYWQQMQAEGIEPMVDDFESSFKRFKIKRRLRSFWFKFKINQFDIAYLKPIADSLQLEYDWLVDQLYSKEYFEHLWEDIEHQLIMENSPLISKTNISAAITQFRAYFGSYHRVMIPVKESQAQDMPKTIAV